MEGIEVPRDQKPVHALHEGVPQAFLPISESNVDYSTWIAEGRTRLIPKPGELSSVNERLITSIRSLHLVSLMESGKRGAKEGCSRTFDNMMMDRSHHGLSQGKPKYECGMGRCEKAYDSVDDKWLCDIMEGHRFPYWLFRLIRHTVETPR